MAAFAPEEVPKVLAARGWTPRTLGERTWRCTVQSGAGPSRLVVRHAGSWLYLTVMPFLEPESIKPWGGGKYPPRFLGRILAVNANLTLVKFALDDDGDLALRVELPTESLQLREVETAISLLYTTTEQYREPIRAALLDAGRLAEQAAALFEATRSEPPPFPGAAAEASDDEPAPAVTVSDEPAREAPPRETE